MFDKFEKKAMGGGSGHKRRRGNGDSGIGEGRGGGGIGGSGGGRPRPPSPPPWPECGEPHEDCPSQSNDSFCKKDWGHDGSHLCHACGKEF